MVKAIVGANWGDEGKGKVTDLLSETSDIVVRFQGGANAGHTIINDYGKFALHLIPSGACNPGTMNVIGNGVALDIPELMSEIEAITKAGVPAPQLLISDRVQLLMPYHVLQDTYEEERLAGNAFGSTKSGIAPFYSDKYAKNGIQINKLFDEESLRKHLDNICTLKNALFVHLYHKDPIDADQLFNQLMEWREMIRPYVGNVQKYLKDALAAGKTILLEGQLGSLKDPDFGIYPMTTSSHTLASFGCVGAGISPKELKKIYVVTKAYSSAVGAGEFVSELFGDEAEELRRRGGDAGEYGAKTGRPRRVGWFDAVATRYGCEVQGATDVVLTCLDVLGYLDEIKICTGYEIDGEITRDFPVTPVLKKAKPVFTTLPGWKSDVRGIQKWEELPENARKYVEFIEKELGIPVSMVSTGPKRHEILYR
ncbi:MAG: adenylosuccinate synthase [Oscillospiraceae bacterium]|nr:adenylosuccinate synthase [Oscillospiraceae bacterium]